MSVFNNDIISLPEINADNIKEVSIFVVNNHRSHEELMEIINNIVHGIYYNAKAGIYPENMEWCFEGRLFGIPQAYAADEWIMRTLPPPSWKKMHNDAEDTIKYIGDIFVQLGFEFEYVKNDKTKGLSNFVLIHIPFEISNFGSFAQNIYSKTIGADLTPITAIGNPVGKLFYMDILQQMSNVKS